jgi:hypothetical protein
VFERIGELAEVELVDAGGHVGAHLSHRIPRIDEAQDLAGQCLGGSQVGA